jgi:hypothetical protein
MGLAWAAIMQQKQVNADNAMCSMAATNDCTVSDKVAWTNLEARPSGS